MKINSIKLNRALLKIVPHDKDQLEITVPNPKKKLWQTKIESKDV